MKLKGKLANTFANAYPDLGLGRQEDLSRAYIAGFEAALSTAAQAIRLSVNWDKEEINRKAQAQQDHDLCLKLLAIEFEDFLSDRFVRWDK